MATGKKFYWMKLKDSFMTSDTIDYFMSQPDGANYVVLYQMLCLKTINTNGRLCRQIGEVIIPYDVEKIRRDCKWFSADTIRIALNLYKSFGLIYEEEDGTLTLANHAELVGSETDYARQKKNQRISGRSTPALPADKTVDISVDNVHTNVHTEIRDKRLDIRDKENRDIDITKEKEIDKEKESSTSTQSNICAEPEKSDSTPPIVSIVLNDGSFYPVSDPDYRQWCELFQAVDVLAELRKMVAWCDANPAKRKTKRGVKSFIVKWLSKAQDQGGSSPKYDRRNNSFQRHGDALTPRAQRAIQEALKEGESDG